MENASTGSIYLVEHDPLTQTHLCNLLSGSHYKVQTFASYSAFETEFDKLTTGIVLLKAAGSAYDTVLKRLHTMRKHRPDMQIIMLCETPELPNIVTMMRGGADYCLELPVDCDLLFGALQELGRQGTRFKAKITAREIEAKLTARQFQVLKLLLDGMQNKRVGVALGISERTVEIHRSKIMRQLDVENFASLVRLATQCGITPD